MFGIAALVSFWRFWNLRYWREFADESDNASAGWLIGKGFRLYDTLFEPHMPLAYIVAHVANVVYPPEGFAKFRVAVWLFYLLAAASFVFAPVPFSVTKRACAGTIFLILTALLAPAWWGEMLLGENISAGAVIVFLNFFVLPKLLAPGVPISRLVLLTAGVALGWWVSGSLVTLYPLLVTIAISAVLLIRRSLAWSELGFVLLGVVLVGLFELFWVVEFGSLKGFFEQAIEFNIQVYSGFLTANLGYSDGSFLVVTKDALLTGARNAVHYRESGVDTLTLLFLISAFPFFTVLVRKTSGLRTGLVLAGGVLLFVVALKARRSEFHGAPYYMSVLFLATWVLVHRVSHSRRAVVLSVGAGLACLGASSMVARKAFQFRSGFTNWSGRDPRVEASIQHVRRHTTPEDRVAALPMLPIFYYATQREPAHRGVFFLPWNAAWEQRFRNGDTCRELASSKPLFIWLARRSVWGHPFPIYARCIDQFVTTNYREVDADSYPNLYVRLQR